MLILYKPKSRMSSIQTMLYLSRTLPPSAFAKGSRQATQIQISHTTAEINPKHEAEEKNSALLLPIQLQFLSCANPTS